MLFEVYPLEDKTLPCLIVDAKDEDDARYQAAHDDRDVINLFADVWMDETKVGVDLLARQSGVIFWMAGEGNFKLDFSHWRYEPYSHAPVAGWQGLIRNTETDKVIFWVGDDGEIVPAKEEGMQAEK